LTGRDFLRKKIGGFTGAGPGWKGGGRSQVTEAGNQKLRGESMGVQWDFQTTDYIFRSPIGNHAYLLSKTL
jgi:hypothetical protein